MTQPMSQMWCFCAPVAVVPRIGQRLQFITKHRQSTCGTLTLPPKAAPARTPAVPFKAHPSPPTLSCARPLRAAGVVGAGRAAAGAGRGAPRFIGAGAAAGQSGVGVGGAGQAAGAGEGGRGRALPLYAAPPARGAAGEHLAQRKDNRRNVQAVCSSTACVHWSM